jgi:hypothetical protein
MFLGTLLSTLSRLAVLFPTQSASRYACKFHYIYVFFGSTLWVMFRTYTLLHCPLRRSILTRPLFCTSDVLAHYTLSSDILTRSFTRPANLCLLLSSHFHHHRHPMMIRILSALPLDPRARLLTGSKRLSCSRTLWKLPRETVWRGRSRAERTPRTHASWRSRSRSWSRGRRHHKCSFGSYGKEGLNGQIQQRP